MAITPETLKLSAEARKKLLAISDAHYLALVTAWVAAWDDLAPELETAMADVFLSAKDGKVPRGAVARNARLAAALQLARQRLVELADSVGVTVGPDLPTVAVDGRTAQANMIASQLPAAQVNIIMDKFTAAPIDAMVARTLTQIHKDTRPLADDVVRMMKSELVRGISLGNNPRKTGQRIIKRAEGRFNGGMARAVMIARNETLDMHRAGALLADTANKDILEGWRWSASLSGRTCPSCLANHGTMHDAEEPGPIDHHQGRCARVPVTKSWKELGFDVEEPADTFPDARAWFDNLDEPSQIAIMGKGRLELLNADKIQWGDLTTRTINGQWRDSMTVTPLATLKKQAERAANEAAYEALVARNRA